MKPDMPERTGQFAKVARSSAPVETDCSSWAADAGETWTVGQFVKVAVSSPPIDVDCSSWGQEPVVALELKLETDPAADPVSLALGMSDLLRSMDSMDQALGGAGLRRVAVQQTNGTVTIRLAPNEPRGAAERIPQLCDRVNRAGATPFARSLVAKVA